MDKIVECVPNFSEGRNRETIDAIAAAIRKSGNCQLLDVDAGQSTNRTVYTFVGDPESVVEGALAAARQAAERIDMRGHNGEHPRLGALDVCPFVPVAGVSMADCVQIARTFAQRAAQELNIPIYLYAEAAINDERRRLSDIRQGEYEALARRLKDPRWRPDFGPAEFVPAWGATVVGARTFLIAYNINILGTPNQAHRIALNLREAGRGPDQPGRLKAVQGMGWFVDEYNLAQVTANLTDFRITGLHTLYEEVKKEAAQLNVGVAGSEIVGVVPLQAMLLAADYYIDKENLLVYQEDQKIRLAVERLGLNSVAPFNPAEKIIEYRVAGQHKEPLAGMPLRGFIEAVAARGSAPGGGSVSVAAAAMGVALAAMTAKLTYGVLKFESVDGYMRQAIPVLHQTCMQLIPMIDADTMAYNEFMEGLRMPKETEAQQAARWARMQDGLKKAVEVPLQTMRLADSAWDAMDVVARYGKKDCLSDIQVGVRALETGIWGAGQNVHINLEGIGDEAYRNRILQEAETLAARAAEKCAEVLAILSKR